MKSPTLTLHKAQVDRLAARTSYSICDDHPENAKYPYITTGEIRATDWSDKSQSGQEVTATLHVWSIYKGRKEADEMADAIEQAITMSYLDLSPVFKITVQKFESYDLITDMDGKTRHGIIKFRYLIEEL